MNIVNRITDLANSNPDKIALLSPDYRLTYQELEAKINQTANAFEELGVKEGERILIQIGNRLEFSYCFFAAMKIQAIIVPINPTYTSSEISVIAEDCQPILYICEQNARDNIETVNHFSKHLKHFLLLDEEDDNINFESVISKHSTSHRPFAGDDHSVCQILYTSGTTGRPKGAMLTHDGLAGNAKAYSDILHCNENDIVLIVAPLYHAASQTNCLNNMIISGGTSYILPRFSPDKVLETLEKEKITVFFGPPTMYTIMLNSPNIKNYSFNLRIAFTGSAPMAVKIHKQWEELFGFSILEGYGLSECSPIVANHRPEGVIKTGSVGPALPGITVKFVDENDREVPIGEKGELVVSGPNVMKGYWNRKEETEIALRNGWLHTGDIGYQDEDGYLYIIDRKKDLINRGGMKIYPREIEEVLYQYQAFLEVSVVGEADEVLGEEVVAYVTLKEKDRVVELENVQSFCREKLAPYKIPRKLYILEEMPKTLSGKIQKVALRK